MAWFFYGSAMVGVMAFFLHFFFFNFLGLAFVCISSICGTIVSGDFLCMTIIVRKNHPMPVHQPSIHPSIRNEVNVGVFVFVVVRCSHSFSFPFFRSFIALVQLLLYSH